LECEPLANNSIGGATASGTPVGWWAPNGGTALNAVGIRKGTGSLPTWQRDGAQMNGVAVPANSFMALFTNLGTTPGMSLTSDFTLYIVFTVSSVDFIYPALCRQQQTETDTNNYCDIYGDWGGSRTFFTFRRMITNSRVTQENQSVNAMDAGGTYILACAASSGEMEQTLV
jgi:hypothetical protein